MKCLTNIEAEKLKAYIIWLEKIVQSEGYDTAKRFSRVESVFQKLLD